MPATRAQNSRPGSAWAFRNPVAKGLDTTSAHILPTVSTWATPTTSASESIQLSNGLAPPTLSLYHQSASSRSQQNIRHGLGQSPIAQESDLHGLPLDDAGISKESVATSQDEHKSKNKPVSQPLEPYAEDMLMHEAPQTPIKPQQHTPSMLPSPSPSPRTPIVKPLTFTTPGFRRPFLPASAIKDSIPAAKNVRPHSQASASTYRASGVTQSQRDLSVTSRTSVSSRSSVARGKRKVDDLSSDEESDYSPPSEDDEPKSLVIRKEACMSMKGNTKTPRLATKKTKLPPPLPPAMASKSVFSKGKNRFGFQPTSKPKPKVNNQAAFSLPSPSQHAPIMKPLSFPPVTPTPASKKAHGAHSHHTSSTNLTLDSQSQT